jgi:hypothetical protein
MASLKITRASGELVCKITPAIEYAFETRMGMGIHKKFSEDQKQSDIYWLAWECLRRLDVVQPFGDDFLQTLISVEVVDDSDPNG